MKSQRRNEMWAPPELTRDVVQSVQAITAYAAKSKEGPDQAPVPSPQDCKRMLDWIIEQLCLYYDNGFIANDPNGRIAAFIDGRQFVAKEIVTAMKIRPELTKKQSQKLTEEL